MKLGYEFYHRPCLEVARDLVGIGYASQEDQERPWRFLMNTASGK